MHAVSADVYDAPGLQHGAPLSQCFLREADYQRQRNRCPKSCHIEPRADLAALAA